MATLVNKLTKSIKKILPEIYWPLATRLKGQLFGFGKKSYAQHGEDLLLRALLGPKETGFYVDIGAHHPRYLSNTHFFYQRGWRGINIDPMPNCMRAFRRVRKRDVNLEIALSDKKEDLTFYMFNNRCVNTLSHEYAMNLKKDKSIALLCEKRMTTSTLAQILDQHLPPSTSIDFISLDAEEYDLPILKGNDWVKYRPTVLVVEDHEFSLLNPEKSKIYQFLNERNYQLAHKSVYNLFFIDLAIFGQK